MAMLWGSLKQNMVEFRQVAVPALRKWNPVADLRNNSANASSSGGIQKFRHFIEFLK